MGDTPFIYVILEELRLVIDQVFQGLMNQVPDFPSYIVYFSLLLSVLDLLFGRITFTSAKTLGRSVVLDGPPEPE